WDAILDFCFVYHSQHPKVRNVFNLDFPDSNHLSKSITIVTGMDMVNLTYYNFFASKEKITPNWAADVLAIAYNASRNNSCRQIFLDKIFVRICIHTNKDGKIPVKHIYKMFPADKKRVESALAAAHLPKGKYDTIKPDVFTEAAFKIFLMNLCPRPEIYEIFSTYTAKPFMTKDIFTKFLNEKQRDSRLNEELFPRLRADQIKALIEKYEPGSNKGQISPEGLMFYLMGSETSIIIQDRLATCNDMTQPIPHYFIKSSHNTYLTAGQFSGVSTPEMYRQCLLSGCRCLELDCWKGKPPDEEPYITHGFTMTTEILFKDVIEAINESAFKTSPFPVVLSFENHVDSYQQEKMANYCRTIFGDALLTEPLEKYPLKPGQQIPSPSELMGKILIKNKKGHDKPAIVEQAPLPEVGDAATDPAAPGAPPEAPAGEMDPQHSVLVVVSEAVDLSDDVLLSSPPLLSLPQGTAGQEVTAYEAMSSIVNYIQPNKFMSFENSKKKNKSYGISSFVETKGEAMIAKSAVEFVEYNRRQMSRIYPKGTRMDSSNYNPQPFWNAGCQFVALNYQTMDFPMQLNMALFEYNGRSGYLLKHDVMRRSDKKFDPFCERIDTIIANTLSIKIYSGQFLSDKSVKTGVEAEIIGLPGDPKKKFRTKWTATANAINPVWNEEPFVFEKILLPEMASLRLVVHEENGKFLGHRILPLDAIQSGFQHIALRSEGNMVLTLPALFVYIEIKDYIPAAFAGAPPVCSVSPRGALLLRYAIAFFSHLRFHGCLVQPNKGHREDHHQTTGGKMKAVLETTNRRIHWQPVE
uniref:Phosphoinositide phospholipase C n=1 Tax=Gadus morhua TaxID=8049 RepID=A0A8C5FE92_GADMO